jgi:hypothetical protein
MTFDQILDSPVHTREEKLVAAYSVAPHRLSRAVFSLIDSIFEAPPRMRSQLEKSFPLYGAAVLKFELGALEVSS